MKLGLCVDEKSWGQLFSSLRRANPWASPFHLPMCLSLSLSLFLLNTDNWWEEMHSREKTKREKRRTLHWETDWASRENTHTSANCFSSRGRECTPPFLMLPNARQPNGGWGPADGSGWGRDALFHFQHLFTSTLPSERKPDLHYIRLHTPPPSPLQKKKRKLDIVFFRLKSTLIQTMDYPE